LSHRAVQEKDTYMDSTSCTQLSLRHSIDSLVEVTMNPSAENFVVASWSGPHTSQSAASMSMPTSWPPSNTHGEKFISSAVT
jgi:hypothetical protein